MFGKRQTIARKWSWGQVHEGDRFNIQIGTDQYDTYPNSFMARVRVTDKATGKTHEVTGHGEFCGNFSPIWVKVKGVEGNAPTFASGHNFRRKAGRDDEAKGWKFIQLTELERAPLPVK